MWTMWKWFFNYDIPNDVEYYVHRIGRTGRAGRSGKAYTFVSGREIYKLRDIQRYTKSKILPQIPPSVMDVEGNKVNLILEKVRENH
jgi:ATP-dependent RNA helicase DeaD